MTVPIGMLEMWPSKRYRSDLGGPVYDVTTQGRETRSCCRLHITATLPWSQSGPGHSTQGEKQNHVTAQYMMAAVWEYIRPAVAVATFTLGQCCRTSTVAKYWLGQSCCTVAKYWLGQSCSTVAKYRLGHCCSTVAKYRLRHCCSTVAKYRLRHCCSTVAKYRLGQRVAKYRLGQCCSTVAKYWLRQWSSTDNGTLCWHCVWHDFHLGDLSKENKL